MDNPFLQHSYESRLRRKINIFRWRSLHVDPVLIFLLFVLACMGLLILYSASNSNRIMVEKQCIRLLLSFGVMFLFAQISPKQYHTITPWFYTFGLVLLIMVLLVGKVHQGARRWFDLGLMNIQPSEIMKLAMPMMLSYYFSNKSLPPRLLTLSVAILILAFPVLLTMKQPDLGTAILIASSGLFVLILAGLNWRMIVGFAALCIASTPIIWHYMHQYQRDRMLTFFNPERDPLGTGYHIIQSKIAIGSGGILGKGWLHGTQSHLQFLPAHATDFIFAVSGEEFGLIGCIILIMTFLCILARCLYISSSANDSYSRLLAGGLSLTFITSALINIGMVIGILPVVGVPLPLISYGGSSMITLMAGFGIIISIYTHRKLWPS